MAKVSDSDRRKQGESTDRAIPITSAWETRLVQNGTLMMNGAEKKHNLTNAIAILEHHPDWKNVLAFNENSLTITLLKRPPWRDSHRDFPCAWTANDNICATEWLQRVGVEVGVETTKLAAARVASLYKFHPVKKYLESLKWDGGERIDSWLCTYMGAEDCPYIHGVSRCFLISAVARLYQPGCQVDTCPIFEGGQGTFKSSALRTLASPWFTDQLPDIRNKDAAIQLAGVWLVELAELSSLQKVEREHIKSFISRRVDRYRPVNGSYAIDVPRQTVFAGTSNDDSYLRDETGGRRFWPVKINWIELEQLEEDHDQLWAEALVCYQKGKPEGNWWFNEDLDKLARVEQSSRREVDAWEPLIETYIHGMESIAMKELLGKCLDLKKGEWDRSHEMRVARCLKALHWKRYRDYELNEWRYKPNWIVGQP